MKNDNSLLPNLSQKNPAWTPVCALAAGLFLLAGALSAQAQTTWIKAANTTALGTSGSWVAAGVPASGDIAEWNSVATSAGDTLTSMGGAFTIGEIQIASSVAGAVSITDATAADLLTLNGNSSTAVGIDMSGATAGLTIGTSITLGGNQTWNIASGQTLTINGLSVNTNVSYYLNFNGHTVTINGPGIVAYNGETAPAVPTGTWAGALVLSNTAFNITMLYNGIANGSGGQTNSWFDTVNMSLTCSGTNIFSASYPAGTEVFRMLQTFTNLTLNPGSTAFIYVNPAATNQAAFQCSFTNLTRNAGSMADFTPATATGHAFDTSGSAADFDSWFIPGTGVLGFATWFTNDWLQSAGAFRSPWIATYTADTYTPATNDVGVVAGTAPPSGFTINSWHFNTAIAANLALGGANTITSGGILLGQTVGANTTTIAGPGTLTSGNGTDLIVINNNDLAGAGNLVISAPIVGGIGLTVGSTDMANTAPGLVQLGGANTFTGPTYITKGVLQLANALALQDSQLNYSLPGTLSFGTLTAATIGGLNGVNNLAVINSTGSPAVALTLAPASPSTYSGILSDASAGSSLTLAGTSSQTLNGANTYTGATIISSGTLALGVGGSIANSSVSLAGGATFDVSAVSTAAAPYNMRGTSFTASGDAPATLNIASAGYVTNTLPTTLILTSVAGAVPLPALTVAGGALVLSNNQFTINGPILPPGIYTLANTSGTGAIGYNA
ncbi:MAG: autotransporter-associated beta strand repeat-containing protein, partial [Verrucomicrobiota bacterium]